MSAFNTCYKEAEENNVQGEDILTLKKLQEKVLKEAFRNKRQKTCSPLLSDNCKRFDCATVRRGHVTPTGSTVTSHTRNVVTQQWRKMWFSVCLIKGFIGETEVHLQLLLG
jgi:hypothetical protein